VLVALIVTAVLVTTGLKKGKRGDGGGWTEVFGGEKDSVVLTKDEISRIWEWEVLSGHHPSLVDGKFWILARLLAL
jgi:WD repeat and SOF domain-containing protein 1